MNRSYDPPVTGVDSIETVQCGAESLPTVDVRGGRGHSVSGAPSLPTVDGTRDAPSLREYRSFTRRRNLLKVNEASNALRRFLPQCPPRPKSPPPLGQAHRLPQPAQDTSRLHKQVKNGIILDIGSLKENGS